MILGDLAATLRFDLGDECLEDDYCLAFVIEIAVLHNCDRNLEV